MSTLPGSSQTRRLTLLSIVAGVTVLSIWTPAIDHTLVLTERAVSPENPWPTNVIDLAGYCGIGLFDQRYVIERKKSNHWLYIPIIIMLVMMLLTQSRGPLISLAIAICCTLHLHLFTRRNLLIIGALLVLIGLVLLPDASGRHAAYPFLKSWERKAGYA